MKLRIQNLNPLGAPSVKIKTGKLSQRITLQRKGIKSWDYMVSALKYI